MPKLTDLIKEMTTAPAQGDLMHIVDISDTSEDPNGSSYKIQIQKLFSEIISNNITINEYIEMNTSYSDPITEGQFAWDAEAGTIRVGMPGGVVFLQVGQEQHLPDRPKNVEGAQIDDGQIVYISSATGAVPEVKLANASDFNNACKTIAVATEDVPDNQRGFYTTFGIVRDINTDAFSAGDELWLGTTDGSFTNVRPTAPNCSVRMGYVIRKHATEGSIFVNIDIERDLVIKDITKNPTGFTAPENITASYDSTTRKITLTGTVNGYYRGMPISTLTSGWVSDAHSAVNGQYLLVYDGTAFSWIAPSAIDFSHLLIAFVNYGVTDKWGIRECHGVMSWQTHKELHEVLGTYRRSGGDLADYILASTTAADRRPSVSAAVIVDEDLTTTNPSLAANGPYTQFYLSSTDTANFNTTALDIVPLSGNQPYYNQFTGGAWQQTLMSNNFYTSLWLVGVPVTSDSESQKYRYLWIQGQNQSLTLVGQQGLTPNDVNLGELSALTLELVFLTHIIIQYTAANWQLIEVNRLDGTRFSQTTSTGAFLSSVSTDTTIGGDGTTLNPLSISTVVGDVNITGSLDIDNLNLNLNTLSSTNANGDINLEPNGSGVVKTTKAVYAGNVAMGGNTITALNTSGDLNLTTLSNGDVVLNPNGNSLVLSTTNNRVELNRDGVTSTLRGVIINGPVSTSNDAGEQFFTTSDLAYPVKQILNNGHDAFSEVYDAYFAGINWFSSDAGSNFLVQKGGDKFRMAKNSGTAAGSTFTWDYFWEANTNGAVTKPLQPYFNAYRSATVSNVIGGSVWYKPIFNVERVDVSGNYNTTTGTYTASDSGQHLFTTAVELGGINNTNTEGIVKLVTSNQSYYLRRENIYLNQASTGRIVLGNSVYADMDLGDTAYIEVYAIGVVGIELIGGAIVTWFSGGLIC